MKLSILHDDAGHILSLGKPNPDSPIKQYTGMIAGDGQILTEIDLHPDLHGMSLQEITDTHHIDLAARSLVAKPR